MTFYLLIVYFVTSAIYCHRRSKQTRHGPPSIVSSSVWISATMLFVSWLGSRCCAFLLFPSGRPRHTSDRCMWALPDHAHTHTHTPAMLLVNMPLTQATFHFPWGFRGNPSEFQHYSKRERREREGESALSFLFLYIVRAQRPRPIIFTLQHSFNPLPLEAQRGVEV